MERVVYQAAMGAARRFQVDGEAAAHAHVATVQKPVVRSAIGGLLGGFNPIARDGRFDTQELAGELNHLLPDLTTRHNMRKVPYLGSLTDYRTFVNER